MVNYTTRCADAASITVLPKAYKRRIDVLTSIQDDVLNHSTLPSFHDGYTQEQDTVRLEKSAIFMPLYRPTWRHWFLRLYASATSQKMWRSAATQPQSQKDNAPDWCNVIDLRRSWKRRHPIGGKFWQEPRFADVTTSRLIPSDEPCYGLVMLTGKSGAFIMGFLTPPETIKSIGQKTQNSMRTNVAFD